MEQKELTLKPENGGNFPITEFRVFGEERIK
jgi:hypothetical protein